MKRKIFVLLASIAFLLTLNLNLDRLVDYSLKIIVMGSEKAGTSPLYKTIKDAMGVDTVSFFEPDAAEFDKALDSNASKLLVKITLSERDRYGDLGEAIKVFDKRIMIVRDPRDILISNLLYRTVRMEFSKDLRLRQVFIEKLEQKEKDPAGISVLELYKLREELERQVTGIKGNPRTWHDELEDFSIAVNMIKDNPDIFVFHYEDYIDENLGSLKYYTGLDLLPGADVSQLTERHSVEKSFSHIARTKSYDNWKNWFTPEDIAVFRPLMEEQMRYLGYDDDWQVNDARKIAPEHSSIYVRDMLESLQ